MSEHNTFVATYAQPHLAEIDLGKMQNSGFDFNRVRVVSSNPPSFSELKASPHVLHSFNELEAEFGGAFPRTVSSTTKQKLGRAGFLSWPAAPARNLSKLNVSPLQPTRKIGMGWPTLPSFTGVMTKKSDTLLVLRPPHLH